MTEPACRDGIREVVTEHTSEQTVTVQEVTERFELLLPEFGNGGTRRRDYLWTFAGKDLLLAVEEDLETFGFANAGAFREKILLGIEKTDQDIATWLPEWSALRTAVEAF